MHKPCCQGSIFSETGAGCHSVTPAFSETLAELETPNPVN